MLDYLCAHVYTPANVTRRAEYAQKKKQQQKIQLRAEEGIRPIVASCWFHSVQSIFHHPTKILRAVTIMKHMFLQIFPSRISTEHKKSNKW
jgi:hypothetical protein